MFLSITCSIFNFLMYEENPSQSKYNLQNKKRKRLDQPRQALEGRPVKSFFDFIGRTEASRGARRWSWIKKTS
ncbi:hypothetical protein [Mesobacillus boroniphilus]|uniref:hypothetical protein n=1 Tax=Mesobacillus boroniphilus TaxID=308892 RepID=UPI0011DCC97E|nr:hypothetical protein [Mesobacillus boroniphilus]